MNLKTYRASSIATALGQIKKDLGRDAVILHTRTFRRGGFLGFGGRNMVEITASSSVSVMHPLARKGKAPADGVVRPGSDLLSRTYIPGAVGIARESSCSSRASAVADVLERADDAPDPNVEAEPSDFVEAAGEPVSIEIPSPEGFASARGGVQTTPLSVSVPDSAIWEELGSIKRLVGQVLQSGARSGAGCQPKMPDALFKRYLKLIESEVASEVAEEVIGAVRDELNTDELACDEVVHQAVLRRLAAYVPVARDVGSPARAADGRPTTIALVGPTGVGKTTTIAKLAATYKLRHGKSVGLVTSDTYRIAAVEQLRTYADIISLPLKVALSPREIQAACESLASCDVILVDTAGRSQHDSPRLDELKQLISAAKPHETHLVLSSAASEAVLKRAIDRFSVVRPNRVLFTKLDEAVHFGVLINAARAVDARLSYVTTGQEVPDHIEPSRPDRIARLVLEGAGAS